MRALSPSFFPSSLRPLGKLTRAAQRCRRVASTRSLRPPPAPHGLATTLNPRSSPLARSLPTLMTLPSSASALTLSPLPFLPSPGLSRHSLLPHAATSSRETRRTPTSSLRARTYPADWGVMGTMDDERRLCSPSEAADARCEAPRCRGERRSVTRKWDGDDEAALVVVVVGGGGPAREVDAWEVDGCPCARAGAAVVGAGRGAGVDECKWARRRGSAEEEEGPAGRVV